jgi:hypothetical protein
MSLLALQGDFRAWLETGSDEASARFAAEAQSGLLVYLNNYRAALMACLDESFPRTAQWIGPDAFRTAAARHIDARPPDSWSLDHYAAHLPLALAGQWSDDPEVGDLAALELALGDAFVGADAEALTPDCLPLVDWDKAVLRWVPTARLLVVRSNALAIWSALVAEVEPPRPCRLPQAQAVLVWRQAHVSCFRALEPLEHEIAERFFAGIGFDDVCNRLVHACGEADGVRTAGTWLGRWVADGLLERSGADR